MLAGSGVEAEVERFIQAEGWTRITNGRRLFGCQSRLSDLVSLGDDYVTPHEPLVSSQMGAQSPKRKGNTWGRNAYEIAPLDDLKKQHHRPVKLKQRTSIPKQAFSENLVFQLISALFLEISSTFQGLENDIYKVTGIPHDDPPQTDENSSSYSKQNNKKPSILGPFGQ